MRGRRRRLLGWCLLLCALPLVAAGAALIRLQLPAAAASGLTALLAGVAGLLTMRGTAVLNDHDNEVRRDLRAIRYSQRGRIPLVRELQDPIGLGVHPAASIDLSGVASRLPDFIRRDVMPQLTEALRAGGFVLLVGESTAGKSRVGFEAMRLSLGDHRLIVPSDTGAMPEAAELAAATPLSVVWLDDLERFLGSGGLTAEHVRRILAARGRRAILATMRSEEHARFSERSDTHLPRLGRETARQGWEVLRLATRIDVPRRWSADELDRAHGHRDDARIDDALRHADRFGLAEYLASGPQLLTEWRDAWAPGTHPRGAALVSAAVDARRVGIHRPLPLQLLTQMHEVYLDQRGGLLLRPEPFDVALEWASTSLHATSSLLLPAPGGAYLAFDYLIDAADKVPVPTAALALLISAATPDEAVDLGRSAWRWGLVDQAEAAFRAAHANGHPEAAGWLCDLLFDRGSAIAAVTCARDSLDDRLRKLGPEHPLTLTARHTLAYATGRAGDPLRAVRLYDELIPDAVRLLGSEHELTRRAMSFPAQFTGEAGDHRKAAQMYMELAAGFAAVLGHDHLDVLEARDQAVLWYEHAGELELAVRLSASVLDDALRIGLEQEYVGRVRYVVAHATMAAGHYQEALTIWKQLVAEWTEADGPFSTTSLDARCKVAECVGLAGDAAYAVDLLRQVAADASRFAAVGSPVSIRSARELAHWIGMAGDPQEAVTRLRQLLETTAEQRGDSDGYALGIRWRMADWLGRAGDVAEAVRQLTSVVAEAEAALGPGNGVTQTARERLETWRGAANQPSPDREAMAPPTP